MNLHEFLISPDESARREGPHNKIVMSSRVRLARDAFVSAPPASLAARAAVMQDLGRLFGASETAERCLAEASFPARMTSACAIS